MLTTSVMPGLQYAYATDYNLEIINNEATWNDSYANWWLKVYYENNPSEDLWNVSENRPVNFNDKVYTAKVYLDAECEGEYEEKQFAAYWLSDEVQRITEIGTENVYYIPMFYNVPQETFEMFCNASGGVNAKIGDLMDSSAHYIRIEDAEFIGAGVDHSWFAAVNADWAKYPWAVVSTQNFRWTIAFTYDYGNPKTVYPWWDEEIKSKSVWIASLPTEFEDNTFLIPENAANQDAGWSWTPGASSAFDSSKFTVALIPALTVTFVNWETTTTGEVLSWKTITEPEKPTKEWYVFWWRYLGDELFSFDTPIADDTTLTAKWLSTAWTLTALPAADGSYTATISDDGKTITYTNISEKDPGAAGNDETWNWNRPAWYIWFGSRYTHPEALTWWATFGGETVSDEDKAKGYNDIWVWISATKVQELVEAWTLTKSWGIPASYNWTDSETYNIVIDLNNIEVKDSDENNNTTLIKVVNWKITVLSWEEVKQPSWTSWGGKSSWGGSSASSSDNDKTTVDSNSSKSDETAKDGATVDENNTDEQANEENTNEDKVAPMTDAQAVEKFGQEQIDAYKWALENGITTMKTVEEARLDQPLTRAELAKMMVVYIQKVLEKDPIVTGDVSYSDVDESLGDLYGYIKLAYQYQIMWINADGTPIKFFNPNGLVTRWEYATVFSRVLFGDKFNKAGEDFYTKHLEALKTAGILTNTIPTIQEMRGWVMLMMYRSSQNAEKIENVANTTETNEEEKADEETATASDETKSEANEEEKAEEATNTEATTGDVAETPATQESSETTAENTETTAEATTWDVAEAPTAEASTWDTASN